MLWRDRTRTIRRLCGSGRRATRERWPAFAERMAQAGRVSSAGCTIGRRRGQSAAGCANSLELAAIGRQARALGRVDMVELARMLPMPIADAAERHLSVRATEEHHRRRRCDRHSAGTAVGGHDVRAPAPPRRRGSRGVPHAAARARRLARSSLDAMTAMLRAKGAEIRLGDSREGDSRQPGARNRRRCSTMAMRSPRPTCCRVPMRARTLVDLAGPAAARSRAGACASEHPVPGRRRSGPSRARRAACISAGCRTKRSAA